MTFAQEMHELAEQKSYDFDSFKMFVDGQIRYYAKQGDFHSEIYCGDDNKKLFVKHNRKAIIKWLKSEGFTVKVTRFAEKPEINVYW